MEKKGNTLNIEKQLKTLKGRVEFILNRDIETRNSDKRLTIQIWKEFYPQFMISQPPSYIVTWIDLDKVMDLPSQAGIQRIRAYFQNKLKIFLPTDIDVAKERGWREDDWKKAMGYYVEDPGQRQFSGMEL